MNLNPILAPQSRTRFPDWNPALTKYLYYFQKKTLSKCAIFFLIFGTSFFYSSTANAASTGPATITCANANGTENTFNVQWDNANAYFNGKGDIARLFCEGGHAPAGYNIFVSTSVLDVQLRYYQGVAPENQDTQTSTGDSQTAVTEQDSSTATVPQQPVTSDTPTAQVDTSTATVPQTDSHTVPATVETSTGVLPPQTPTTDSESSTAGTSESQTSTSESSTQTIPQETSTTITTPSEPSSPIEPAPSVPAVPPAVEPQPVPQPEPVPAPQPQPEPSPTPAPEPEPQPEPVEPEPESKPEPEPTPVEPEPEPELEESSPDPEPAPEPEVPEVPEEVVPLPVEEVDDIVVVTPPTTVEPVPNPVPVHTETITLDNGVVLTKEEAIAVALLQNPGELLQELFTNPAAAFAALGSVGADMSPEVREKAEEIVIATVLVGNIATQAAAGAAAVAAYRRKP